MGWHGDKWVSETEEEKNNREKILLQNALDWIFIHTEPSFGYSEYKRICEEELGMNEEEIDYYS